MKAKVYKEKRPPSGLWAWEVYDDYGMLMFGLRDKWSSAIDAALTYVDSCERDRMFGFRWQR